MADMIATSLVVVLLALPFVLALTIFLWLRERRIRLDAQEDHEVMVEQLAAQFAALASKHKALLARLRPPPKPDATGGPGRAS